MHRKHTVSIMERSAVCHKFNLDMGKFLMGVGQFHWGIDKYFLLDMSDFNCVGNFFDLLVNLSETWVILT